MAESKLRLPRLPVNWQIQPQLVERYWDEAMTAIEKSLNSVFDVLEAKAAAQEAREAAQEARAATNDQAQENSLVQSYPTGLTISCSATGTITISGHTRIYGDSSLNPSVTVQGNTIDTGALAGQVIRVFYSDPDRKGGSVTYQYTIDPQTPPVQGNDIHSVGAATVPNSGSTGGKTLKGPGYVEP